MPHWTIRLTGLRSPIVVEASNAYAALQLAMPHLQNRWEVITGETASAASVTVEMVEAL